MNKSIVTDNKPKQVALSKDEEYFFVSVGLMKVMAHACGHDAFNKFNKDDLATWHREMALLSGVMYSGFGSPTVNTY